MKRILFGGRGSTGGGDYARYEIFKLTNENSAGVRVEDVIGLKRARARVGFLMRGLQKEGYPRYEIRPVSNVGMSRMAWGK